MFSRLRGRTNAGSVPAAPEGALRKSRTTARADNDEFDAGHIRRTALKLIEGLGCGQALERTRRQEQETELDTRLARAIRLEAEALCRSAGEQAQAEWTAPQEL